MSDPILPETLEAEIERRVAARLEQERDNLLDELRQMIREELATIQPIVIPQIQPIPTQPQYPVEPQFPTFPYTWSDTSSASNTWKPIRLNTAGEWS